MVDDFLVIKRVYKDTGTDEEEILSYTVEGIKASNNFCYKKDFFTSICKYFL